MGGRDHSCEGCGNGGFNNDDPCECAYPELIGLAQLIEGELNHLASTYGPAQGVPLVSLFDVLGVIERVLDPNPPAQ